MIVRGKKRTVLFQTFNWEKSSSFQHPCTCICTDTRKYVPRGHMPPLGQIGLIALYEYRELERKASFQKQEFQFTTNKYKRGHQGNVGPSLDNLWPVGKSGVAMLPAESDGEEYILNVRCKMYYSRTSDSNGGKVHFLGGEYICVKM